MNELPKINLKGWVKQACQTKVFGPDNHMETTKIRLHAALFLLKPKDDFIFELFQ